MTSGKYTVTEESHLPTRPTPATRSAPVANERNHSVDSADSGCPSTTSQARRDLLRNRPGQVALTVGESFDSGTADNDTPPSTNEEEGGLPNTAPPAPPGHVAISVEGDSNDPAAGTDSGCPPATNESRSSSLVSVIQMPFKAVGRPATWLYKWFDHRVVESLKYSYELPPLPVPKGRLLATRNLQQMKPAADAAAAVDLEAAAVVAAAAAADLEERPQPVDPRRPFSTAFHKEVRNFYAKLRQEENEKIRWANLSEEERRLEKKQRREKEKEEKREAKKERKIEEKAVRMTKGSDSSSDTVHLLTPTNNAFADQTGQ